MKKQKLVILSGAGMSAESGIATFRGTSGLWEGHRVEEVASPEAFKRNPAMVLDFYNVRRRNVIGASPNRGHLAITQLSNYYDLTVVTQNVDDLHERAGTKNILHLHGEIRKARSTANPNYVVDIDGPNLNLGDLCPEGSQLRPHIVWFGESVPMIEKAAVEVGEADILIVVGTSLQVYPAASLIHYMKPGTQLYLVDPNPPAISAPNLEVLEMGAEEGMAILLERLTT